MSVNGEIGWNRNLQWIKSLNNSQNWVWGRCVTSLTVRSVETEHVFTNICCYPRSNEGLDYRQKKCAWYKFSFAHLSSPIKCFDSCLCCNAVWMTANKGHNSSLFWHTVTRHVPQKDSVHICSDFSLTLNSMTPKLWKFTMLIFVSFVETIKPCKYRLHFWI